MLCCILGISQKLYNGHDSNNILSICGRGKYNMTLTHERLPFYVKLLSELIQKLRLGCQQYVDDSVLAGFSQIPGRQ